MAVGAALAVKATLEVEAALGVAAALEAGVDSPAAPSSSPPPGVALTAAKMNGKAHPTDLVAGGASLAD